MASFYDIFMYPLEQKGIRKARKKLLLEACGKVLELGAGTGANGLYYQWTCIEELTVTDRVIHKHLHRKQDKKANIILADAMKLPFPDHLFDTVVHTLVFCSVADVDAGLQEIKRVLKPDGKLLFIEHVLPEKKGLRALFIRVNPVWRLFSNGCSLTKDFSSSLQKNGFVIDESAAFMNTVFVTGKARLLSIE